MAAQTVLYHKAPVSDAIGTLYLKRWANFHSELLENELVPKLVPELHREVKAGPRAGQWIKWPVLRSNC